MMEKISGENYKQALAEYEVGLGEYREKYRELDKKRQMLMLKHGKLALLRERRLKEVLAEKGLGLCSVELGASFFRCGKHKEEAVLTGLKRLGIFEEEELSLVYFKTYIYHRGGHYEGSGYRYHEGIYQICSFHLQMPIEKVFLVPSLYPFPPHLPPNFEPISKVAKSKEGVFTDKEDKLLLADLYNTGVWRETPEEVFRKFQIMAIPKKLEEDVR